MKSNKPGGKRILEATQLAALLVVACGAAKAGDPLSIPIPCDKPSILPTWGTVYNGGTLCFLGADPRFGQTFSVISVPIVPIIISFLGPGNYECDKYGVGCPVVAVSDPTQPLAAGVNPTSNSGSSALDAVFGSPIFQSQDLSVGSTQLGNNQWGEAMEKASFWNLTPDFGFSPPFPAHPQANWTNWHVIMIPILMPPQRLFVTSGNWSALSTPNFYSINGNVLDTLLDELMSQTSGSVMPIYLTHNVEEVQNGVCCAYSYHNWFKIGGYYTPFIWASWMDPEFSHPDIMPLSHEIAETMLDPFSSNTVPAWPAPGTFPLPWDPSYPFRQCQANLEVGDPVEDRTSAAELQFPITNSVMRYHFQNVATASWLMQASPSFSVNGWYTLNGAIDGEFTAPAPGCPN